MSLILCLALALPGLTGCTGHAQVSTIPLGSHRINESGPLTTEVRCRHCYWWVNDAGEFCIALEGLRSSLLGDAFGGEWRMSLVLEEEPAGRGRDYQVTRQTARIRARDGWAHIRAASLAGIVGVWRQGEDRWRGRFRLLCRQQSFNVLLGWAGNTDVALVGEFTAVPGETPGAVILEHTEAGKLERSSASGNLIRISKPPRDGVRIER